MSGRNKNVAMLTHANLLLHGGAYLVMGVSAFLDPVSKLKRIGLTATTPAATTTFRVIYSGLMLAIALVFLLSSARSGMARYGLLALMLVMGSLIATRTLGGALDRSFNPEQLLWSGIEAAVLLLSLYLYRSQPT